MTDTQKVLDSICNCRKGSMDDKQYRAKVEFAIQEKLAKAVAEERERIANIIDGTNCDMCGQENTMWNCLQDRVEVCNGAKHELLRNLKEK